MKRMACIGECMVELSEHTDGTLTRSFGGDTLNTTLYLARLGVPVDYVTALGNDPFSGEMLQAWKAEGIGIELIPRVPDQLPGLYLIRTDASGERQFFYWRDSAPVRQLFRLPQAAAIEAALCRAGQIYRAVQRCLVGFIGSPLPHIRGEVRRLIAKGISGPVNV